jgi:hypothetical protein
MLIYEFRLFYKLTHFKLQTFSFRKIDRIGLQLILNNTWNLTKLNARVLSYTIMNRFNPLFWIER